MTEFLRELKLRIKDIKKRFPGKTRVFTISSTSKNEDSSYLTPLRFSANIVVTGIVIFKSKDLLSIKKIINDNFKYIFLDNDLKRFNNSKKNLFNLHTKHFSPKKIMAYKPNDITVDSCWSWIHNGPKIKNNNIFIIGMGNIGTKLALKLFESGRNIYVNRRDHKKGKENVEFIRKFIRSKNNFIKYQKNIKGIINKVQLIILCADKNFILNNDVAKKIKRNSTIIDLGKNNMTSEVIKLTEKNMISSYRLDIGTSLLSFVESSIELKKDKLYGRKKYKKYFLISGGYIGLENDIVVDNFKNPSYVIGIANGSGDFKLRSSDLGPNFLKKILNQD